MNKQLEYLTPEVNVFTVQTEGVICQSGGEPNNLTEYLNGGTDFYEL